MAEQHSPAGRRPLPRRSLVHAIVKEMACELRGRLSRRLARRLSVHAVPWQIDVGVVHVRRSRSGDCSLAAYFTLNGGELSGLFHVRHAGVKVGESVTETFQLNDPTFLEAAVAACVRHAADAGLWPC